VSPTISIITATFNCERELPQLVESLRAQTDQNFEWVVADGGSSDGTPALLQALSDLRVLVSSQPDFGIYDALNRALKLASGEYYLVVGADDRLAPDTIARFRSSIQSSRADLIVADVICGDHHFRVKRGPAWLVGDKAYIAHHSVGTAIRRSLHERFGLYTRKLPIAADSLFILQACENGATRHEAGFLAGVAGGGGVSYVDWAGAATELFRAQLMVGRALVPQVLVLLLRFIKGASSGVRQLHNVIFRDVRGS
jgi:glycosyltransferase involved in cell wall biosynthesis